MGSVPGLSRVASENRSSGRLRDAAAPLRVSVGETAAKRYTSTASQTDVSVDPSEKPTDADQSRSNASTKPGLESASRVDQLGAWVAANSLNVEMALAVVTIGVGVLSVPFVAFGMFTALEGETSILAGGLVIAAGDSRRSSRWRCCCSSTPTRRSAVTSRHSGTMTASRQSRTRWLGPAKQ